jgi:hypothetical protein
LLHRGAAYPVVGDPDPLLHAAMSAGANGPRLMLAGVEALPLGPLSNVCHAVAELGAGRY